MPTITRENTYPGTATLPTWTGGIPGRDIMTRPDTPTTRVYGTDASTKYYGGGTTTQVADAFGPAQVAQNLSQMWSLMSSSPYMRSLFGQILMNQNANMGALRQGQGITGANQTGLGQAQQQIQQSSGAMAKSQAMGQAWQQALSATMQNMGLQASLLPAWDQIMNPRRYDPTSLQNLSGSWQSRLQESAFQQQVELAKLLQGLRDQNKGFDWGNFFTSLASVVPFLGG